MSTIAARRSVPLPRPSRLEERLQRVGFRRQVHSEKLPFAALDRCRSERRVSCAVPISAPGAGQPFGGNNRKVRFRPIADTVGIGDGAGMKLSSWAIMVGGVFTLVAGCRPNDVITGHSHQDIKVLDGDTLIFEGRWVRIRGIDAAELGPWANCWSEAALGGASRTALEEMLRKGGPWRLDAVAPKGDQGMVVADVLSRDGGDLADSMAVYGYAARTSGKWDWCGSKPLQEARQDDPLPRGPNTWWPANHMFDKRAGD